MRYHVEIRIDWRSDDIDAPNWGKHEQRHSFNAVSRKHALDKALRFAVKLPCFADRDNANQYVTAEATLCAR